MSGSVLVCWHSKNAKIEVAKNMIRKLKQRDISLHELLYLFQPEFEDLIPDRIEDTPVQKVFVDLSDPSNHKEIYQKLRDMLIPKLKEYSDIHLNISPGTPAMHAVWLMLHAGGAFPANTKVWSTQKDPKTNRTRLDPVHFPITTYLAELRQYQHREPRLAHYEIEAKSPARRSALEKLARYARVSFAPLLLLGERGTGKTRIVESVVAKLKGSEKVVTIPCGGLDNSVLESTIFGHEKGAFTGAESDRKGLLKSADNGILFLDEVQDLPTNIQRKLVRVLQDFRHRYRPLGSDIEISSRFQLVCASNKTKEDLAGVLDADFYDRISHLDVTIPPLRECREDIFDDWEKVWQETNSDSSINTPWSKDLEAALQQSALPGNLRSLQKLAYLILVWLENESVETAIKTALSEWESADTNYVGSRNEQLKRFRHKLALDAKEKYDTWEAAANALECTAKTLREDAKLFQ